MATLFPYSTFYRSQRAWSTKDRNLRRFQPSSSLSNLVENEVVGTAPFLERLTIAQCLHFPCDDATEHRHANVRLAKIFILPICDGPLATDAYRVLDHRKQAMAGVHLFQCHLAVHRSEEHTSELPSLMRISYAFFSLQKK